MDPVPTHFVPHTACAMTPHSPNTACRYPPHSRLMHPYILHTHSISPSTHGSPHPLPLHYPLCSANPHSHSLLLPLPTPTQLQASHYTARHTAWQAMAGQRTGQGLALPTLYNRENNPALWRYSPANQPKSSCCVPHAETPPVQGAVHAET